MLDIELRTERVIKCCNDLIATGKCVGSFNEQVTAALILETPEYFPKICTVKEALDQLPERYMEIAGLILTRHMHLIHQKDEP